MKKNKSSKKKGKQSNNSENTDIQFSDDKILAMKNLAAQIAKSLSQNQNKTAMQLELDEDRQRKLSEKKELKMLTPQALFHYNKDKALIREDTSINKIDDSEAKVGFSEALDYSEKTSKLHYALVSCKNKEPAKIVKKVDVIRKKVVKENSRDPLEKYKKESGISNYAQQKNKKRKKDKEKIIIDHSGTLDGEEVDGLVKTETKKARKEKNQQLTENQDDFVLGKLFHKKGKKSNFKHY